MNRKWASTTPMHIVISEISFDTVNAVSSYKNILYYYSYFNFLMYKLIITKIQFNENAKNILLTRKRLQLKDITLIIIIAKYHLFIIFIKNVENL